VFPIAKRIDGRAVLVLFGSDAERRLYNTAEMLDRRFGRLLSDKIKMRLLLLGAAPNLAMVPTCQPYSLKKTSRGEFTLDLSPPRVLRFAVQGGRGEERSSIKTVKIIGVE
jgi:hypothetical protein